MSRHLLITCLLVAGLGFGQAATAATFTVNSPEDSNDGSCVHPRVDSASDCTLREAIIAANAAGGADTIPIDIDAFFDGSAFDDGDGQFTTTLGSAYSSLTGQTEIDGSGMWDSDDDRPGFRLVPSVGGLVALTFSSTAGSSKVQGLEIQNRTSPSIVRFTRHIDLAASSVVIGTDCDGALDTEERNVLHDAAGASSINVTGASNVIAGNYLGVDDNGTTANGNAIVAIQIGAAGGTYAGADDNIIGFREGMTCTAAQQRNIIAASESGLNANIRIGTGTDNPAADASAAPDGTIVAGNYIGTDKTGSLDLGNAGVGITIRTQSTLNIIGTDGDGVDDEFEGNLISGNATGITVRSGENRIAGNIIGLAADGTTDLGNTAHGILIQSSDNIIGWCDAAVNAALCSDSGAVADQRNTVSGNGDTGVRIGLIDTGPESADNLVYGNFIGTESDGSGTVANEDQGVFIHRTSERNLIGGPDSDQRNVIRGSAYGVEINGDFIGGAALGDPGFQLPAIDNVIENNLIEDSAVGIENYLTENYGTPGATDNTLTGNELNNNDIGIDAWGSSPAITDNTITGGTWGILIENGYAAYDGDNEVYIGNEDTPDGSDPDNASEDLTSQPVITGNTISGTSDGGIFSSDSRPSNYDTLFADNSFSSNANFAVRTAWLGAVEVLDRNGDPIPFSALAGTSVTLSPADPDEADITFTDTNDGPSGFPVHHIYGPSGIMYHNALTWNQFTDYEVSDGGAVTDFNPYTISVSGEYATQTDAYSFDGVDNDDSFPNGLDNGIAVNGQFMYQIAKVESSTVPATPTNLSPTDGATEVSVTPTLTASAYSDASGDPHTSSTWRIYSSAAGCTAGGSGDIHNASSVTELTSYAVPDFILAGRTTYYWRVAYTNSFGNRSNFSACTSFTTGNRTPQFTSTIPDQTTDEDTAISNAFDLDDFTYDPGDTLTYTVTNASGSTPVNVMVTIDSDNQVTITPKANFFGTAQLIFRATDSESASDTSNTVTVTVNSVNDIPTAPSSGFTPADGIVIGDQTPTISWDAASDVEDGRSQLVYEVRASRNADPENNPERELTSNAGQTSVTVSRALNDETQYYWVVRTRDTAGATSAWSAVQTFTISQETATEVTLVKSVQIIQSDISQTASATALGRNGLVRGAVRGAFQVSLVFVVVSSVVLLLVYQRPRHSLLAATKPAAMAFAAMTPQNAEGVYVRSYDSFTRWSRPLSRFFQFSMAAAGVLSILTIASYALSSDEGKTIAPGDTLQYTVEYENASAFTVEDAVIHDALTSDMRFVAGTATVDDEAQADSAIAAGTALTFALGDLEPEATGSVSYRITLTNPVSETSLVAPAAYFTSADVTAAGQIASNEVTNPISAGAIAVLVEDETGTDLAGVTVRFYRISPVSGSSLVATETTDSLGRIFLSGLRAGNYELEADLPAEYEPADRYGTFVNYDQTSTVTITAHFLPGEQPTAPTAPDEEPTDEPTEPTAPTEPTEPTEPVEPVEPSEDHPLTPEEEVSANTLITDLLENEITISDLTEEQIELVQKQLENLLELGTVAGITDGTATVYITPSEIQEFLTLTGQAAPGSQVRISVCSNDLSAEQIVVADATGAWTAQINKDQLVSGKNIVIAESAVDGVSTGKKIIGNFVNRREVAVNRTFLLLVSNLFLVLLVSLLVVYFLNRRRGNVASAGVTTPSVAAAGAVQEAASTPAASSPAAAGPPLWQLAGLGLAIALALGIVAYSLIPREPVQEVRFTSVLDLPELSVESANDQPIDPHNTVIIRDDRLVIRGSGLPQASGDVEVCPGVPSYGLQIDENGNWTLEIPVEEIPGGLASFSISLRDEEGNELLPPTEVVQIEVNTVERGAPNWLVVILLIIVIGLSNLLEVQVLRLRASRPPRRVDKTA